MRSIGLEPPHPYEYRPSGLSRPPSLIISGRSVVSVTADEAFLTTRVISDSVDMRVRHAEDANGSRHMSSFPKVDTDLLYIRASLSTTIPGTASTHGILEITLPVSRNTDKAVSDLSFYLVNSSFHAW